MRRISMVAFALLAVGAVSAQLSAFQSDVLRSVVTVLPVRAGDEPAGASGDLRSQERSGSGVVIRKDGYIATSAHVLSGARQVFVRLRDGRELPAEIAGKDLATDLALLRVDEPLPALAFGPEPALGARVCGVGNPFGVGLSVTCGVVSALHRTGMGFNPIEDFIQTDTVLNPGSSGGALVDTEGRLVGLVSAIFTRRSDANIGVNFAVSTALLNRVMEDLLTHGRVIWSEPGIRLARLSRAERRGPAGLRVVAVTADGAAAEAGLREGDIVTTIAGRPVRKRSDARTAIQLHRPGDTFEVTILRDGRRGFVSLTLPR